MCSMLICHKLPTHWFLNSSPARLFLHAYHHHIKLPAKLLPTSSPSKKTTAFLFSKHLNKHINKHIKKELSKHQHSPLAQQQGFTLVEMVMVIIMISALGAIVGPRFFDRSVFDERQAFDELYIGIQSAQRYAIATGCLVQLDISSNGFHLTKDAECFTTSAPDFNKTGFNNEIWHLGEQTMGYQYSAPSGVSAYSTPTNPIIFNGRGQPLNSSLALLNTTTITIGSRSIIIEGDTGYVH